MYCTNVDGDVNETLAVPPLVTANRAYAAEPDTSDTVREPAVSGTVASGYTPLYNAANTDR